MSNDKVFLSGPETTGEEICALIRSQVHHHVEGLKTLMSLLRLLSSSHIDPCHIVLIEDSGVLGLAQDVLDAHAAHQKVSAEFLAALHVLLGKLHPEAIVSSTFDDEVDSQ